MKNILLKLGIFLSIVYGSFAITNEEKIQRDLTKIGVSQEIISETIKLDDEIGDKFIVGEGKELLPKVEELVKKDDRNFKAIDKLIEYYMFNNPQNIKNIEKEVINYNNYNLHSYEKDIVLYIYNTLIGNQVESEKYYKQLVENNKDNWLGKYYQLQEIKDDKVRSAERNKVLKLIKAEKNKENTFLTDEATNYAETELYSQIINEMLKEGKTQEAIDYYIKNIGNSDVSEEILGYNKNIYKNIFNGLSIINETYIENEAKKEKNRENLKNTRVYKILSKVQY